MASLLLSSGQSLSDCVIFLAFGQSGVFGQNSPQTNSSLFSKSSTATPFGSTTTTQSSGFGGFGQNTSLFGGGANQTKPAFGGMRLCDQLNKIY